MKKMFIVLLQVFFLQHTISQNQQWIQFVNNDDVLCMAEAGDILWIGTHNGLVKVNKLTHQKMLYSTFNCEIPANYICALAAEENGKIWIGTYYGLSSFDGSVWTNYNSGNSGMVFDWIIKIAIDKEGIVWFYGRPYGIFGYGVLMSYDGNEWKTYTTSNSGLPDNNVELISFDNNGLMWIGTGSGFVTYDGHNWLTCDSINSGLPGDISAIAFGNDNVLWFGTEHHIISSFDGYNWHHWHLTGSLQGNYFNTMELDEEGLLWFSTIKGLVAFNGSEWTTYDRSNSPLKSNRIHYAMVDSEGKKWVASDKGVLLFNGQTWEDLKISPIPSNQICNIKTEGNKKWICTEEGLTSFDGSEWRVYDTSNSDLPDDNVNDIAIGKDGKKWVTGSGTLTSFDESDWMVYNSDNSPLEQNVGFEVAIGKDGIIWVLSKKLYRFDGISWTSYQLPCTLLPYTRASNLEVEDNGTVWFTYYQSGLYSFNGYVWSNYNALNSGLPLDLVSDIAIDKEGKKWVNIGELAVFDGVDWIKHDSGYHGFPFTNVQMLEINQGDIWVKGSYLDGGESKTALASYNGSEWTIHDVNGYSPYCMAVDNDGTIWMGLDEGLFAYNPNGVPLSKPETIKTETGEMNVYPNPSSTHITVETPGAGNLSIINLNGKEILNQHIRGSSTSINISQIPHGVYLLRFVNDNRIECIKFLKN